MANWYKVIFLAAFSKCNIVQNNGKFCRICVCFRIKKLGSMPVSMSFTVFEKKVMYKNTWFCTKIHFKG